MKTMKKIYSLLSVLAIASSSLLAQSLQLQTQAGQVIHNGGTVGVLRSLYDTTTDVLIEIDMKNISAASQTYKVKRTVKILPSPQSSYFCFAGGCFSDTTNYSPNSLTLAPNTLDNNFSAHINPNSTKGSALVYYKFYNVNNANDTIGIYVQSEIWYSGVSSLSASQVELGPVFPNPANEKFNVEYTLNDNVSARLVLRNMLGSTILEEAVSGLNGKIQVNSSDLPEGIYFCSLFVDGKSVSTRKLVIRH
jgi:hypothetical protein